MVRTGIAIYGLDPFHDDPVARDLRPAMRLTSYVAAVREVEPGEFGRLRPHLHRRRALRASAIVPIGYADGIARRLSNRGEVLVAGRRCRISGTISMDQLTVLLPDDHGGAGDEVVFIGAAGRRAHPRRGRRPPARDDQLRGDLRRGRARGAPLHRRRHPRLMRSVPPATAGGDPRLRDRRRGRRPAWAAANGRGWSAAPCATCSSTGCRSTSTSRSTATASGWRGDLASASERPASSPSRSASRPGASCSTTDTSTWRRCGRPRRLRARRTAAL